ncbi:MAG: hypothetical protein QXF06_06335 [Archaeoglobaceae archaeon]
MVRNSKKSGLKGFNSISDLKTVLGEFYMHERLPKRKLRRLECFITSKLAEKLWKCLGIALLMSSNSNFNFVAPIPVDYRIRELTKRLGAKIENDEDIKSFWSRVLS